MFRKILKLLRFPQVATGKKSFVNGNFTPNKVPKRDLELEGLLIEVAQEFEDRKKFKEAAFEVRNKLEFGRARELTRYFHENPPEPETLKSKTKKYGLLGVWMIICQDAIFEILFNYKEQAIPTLYSIGFGEYDWTQYKAIDVLCRLANEGIETEAIINNIGKEIQNFRYEAVMPSIESLSHVLDNKEVSKIILEIFDEYSKADPIDGLYILRLLALNYPNEVKNKLAYIKAIAKGAGIENRSPLLDGAVLSVDTEGNETYSINGKEVEGSFEEIHKINAAVLYFYLNSEDDEINQLIDFWEYHAKEDTHRSMIVNLKKEKT